jgi:hypothetical protein
MTDHTRVNQLVRAAHLAFSPHLAPSDLHLFSKVKMALIGATFSDGHELFQCVMVLGNGMREKSLKQLLAMARKIGKVHLATWRAGQSSGV